MRSILVPLFALFPILFMLGCSSPYHGTLKLQDTPDYTGKSFAVAPPRQTVVPNKEMKYRDKTFALKKNWDSLQAEADSVVFKMYSRFYGHELKETPEDSLWNACLNWEKGELVPVWSRRNDLDAHLDSFWLYMPAMTPRQCGKIDKDFLVVPGVPMIYPVGFATAAYKMDVKDLSAFLMTGNGVWDNRQSQWIRLSAQQDSVNLLKEDPENDLVRRARYSFHGMPEGKQWQPYYQGVLKNYNQGLELYLSGAYASPHLSGFDDMGLDYDMSFKALSYSLGARYIFDKWGIEAQWTAQSTAYDANIPTSSYEESNAQDEWAMHTRKYQAGVVYYPVRNPLIGGLGFVAVSGGLGYEQIQEWHPVSEFLGDSAKTSKPSGMGMIYLKPSFGYKSLALVSIDTPLELSLGSDGILFQMGIQLSLGIHL